MRTEQQTTRIVRSWLEEGVTALPDRVLDTVLDQVPATPQRRPWWRAWRSPYMNNPVRLAITAAAVLVVALVGYQFLPSNTGSGGPPTATPSPTPTPVVSAAPTLEPPLPPAGPLALGRHRVILEDVPFTLEIAQPGWTSNGDFGFDKGQQTEPDGMFFLLWVKDADFVYQDSCAENEAPPVGPTAADMAAAIAGMPQLELVSGPTAMTLDGNPTQQVVVRIPDEIGCAGEFWLWGDNSGQWSSRYASAPGSTIWVWIIDVDGKRVQIDGEGYAGAGPEIAEELQAIVESIRFE